MTRRTSPLPFNAATRRHAMLGRLVNEDTSALAAEAYAGVTGIGYRQGSLVADAIADTTPPEYAALVLADDIAAAAAASVHLQALLRAGEPGTPRAARAIAHAGWAEFRALAERARDGARGTGADDSEAWPIMARVEELNPDPAIMRQIAELAGRMVQALRGAMARRAAPLPEEITGVELGGDVTGLLPTEYALLGIPATEALAYQRIAERRAQQYERRGRERVAKGALVICLDQSGSMMSEPRRNVWAKAAATALTRLAWEDKRPVVWVHFSMAARAAMLLPGDHVGLAEAQATFLDGGTHIPNALRVGLDEVRELERQGRRGADIVLISDGVTKGARELPRVLDELQQQGVRLWAVAIEVDWRTSKGGIYDSSALAERAERYIHLTGADMRSPAGVTKLAGAVTPRSS